MELVPEFYVGDLRVDDYPFSVIRDDGGLDLGNPESILQVIESLVVDGQDMGWTGTTNRTMVLPLLVEGTDLLDLAQNEETLIRACAGERNTFTLDPGDGYAPPTVFDTFKIDAKHTRDDRYESALVRRWDLTFPAQPWGRSPVLVTQTLTPTSSPTITVLDPCTSASAWSGGGYYTATITQQTYLSESVIRATHGFTDFYIDHSTTVTWTGAAGTDPYVYIDVCWDGDGSPLYRNIYMGDLGGGGHAPFAVDVVTHGTGLYSRYWFENNPGATSLTFVVSRKWNSTSLPSIPVPLRIAQLVSSTAVGSSSIQTVETIGSVRAPGSITATNDDLMTYLFVYSDPYLLDAPYSPAIEDSWSLAPDGTYVIYVDSLGGLGDVVEVTVTDAAGRESMATTRLTAREAAWTFRPIGEVRLGGFRDGRLGDLTFTATVNGTPTALTMANVRLFRKADDTALTYIDGISANTVEMATPSTDLPRGGMWADDVACFDKAVTWALPPIEIPRTAVYAESDGTDPPAVTVGYFPRANTYNAYVPES